MRKCIRCQSDMIENCSIKVERGGYGIEIVSGTKKLFAEKMGKPSIAVCPKCGEISLYIKDVGE